MAVRSVPLSCLDASPELLQSGFWGSFKNEHGWKALPFEVTLPPKADSAGGATFGLLVLTRTVARRFPIAYVPFGPVIDPGTGRGSQLALIARTLKPELPRGTLFLRFDLPWPRTGESPAHRGVVKCGSDMQPASTVVVDITRPAPDVLAGMKSKTRYNIRLAEKKGVTVVEAGAGDLERWYELYRETARRDGIGIHTLAYYRGLMESARAYGDASPRVMLLLAMHEGDLLAGNIVAFWKDRAAYLYGASSGLKRNLMPTYALQWDAIQRAQAAGCRTYDLYGVPPRPDPAHPMFGLYQFKTGFSEEVLERWGTWDAVYRPGLRALFGAAEALRMFYYRTLKKRFGRRAAPLTA